MVITTLFNPHLEGISENHEIFWRNSGSSFILPLLDHPSKEIRYSSAGVCWHTSGISGPWYLLIV